METLSGGNKNELNSIHYVAEISYRLYMYFIIILSVASLLLKIIFGLDQDEQSAYAVMYRFASGDMWLVDLFDIKQVPALIMTPLFKISMCGNLSFTVLFFRIISVIIRCVLALYFYIALKQFFENKMIISLAILCWVTITPKFIIALDHSHFANIVLALLLLELFLIYKEAGSAFRLGVWFTLFVFAYPTMALLFIPIIFCTFKYGKKLDVIRFLSACALLCLLVFLPVIIRTGITEMVETILMVTNSTSSIHLSITEKILNEKDTIIYDARYIAAYLCIAIAERLLKKGNEKAINALRWIRIVIICIPFYNTILNCFKSVSPFKGLDRYLIVVAALIIEGIIRKSKISVYFGILIALVFSISFYSTSNGIVAASGFITFVSAIIVLLISENGKKQAIMLASFVIISQCIVSGCHYRVSGTLSTSIFDMKLVQNSEYYKGIFIEPETDLMANNTNQILSKIKSENILFVGDDMFEVVFWGKRIIAPQTNATFRVTELWERYYKKNPIKNIDIVVEKDEYGNVEKLLSLFDSLNYSYSEENVNEYEIYHIVGDK